MTSIFFPVVTDASSTRVSHDCGISNIDMIHAPISAVQGSDGVIVKGCELEQIASALWISLHSVRLFPRQHLLAALASQRYLKATHRHLSSAFNIKHPIPPKRLCMEIQQIAADYNTQTAIRQNVNRN